MSTLLNVTGLGKSFGGVQALKDVGFAVEAGSVHAVIGPNGAGKTTLFNLVSGLYTPSAGQVVFDGADVTGLSPRALAQAGMSRTFQNLQVCMNLGALENVMVGAHLRLRSTLRAALWRGAGLRRAESALREEALALMDFVGVAGYADAPATRLPYGALKRLEIARALAARPRLLLLDEPAAGLNATETAALETVIRQIAARGITVLLVEHDMKLVMAVAQRLLVLDFGRKLAEGSGEEVRRNPAVIAAYLGQQA